MKAPLPYVLSVANADHRHAQRNAFGSVASRYRRERVGTRSTRLAASLHTGKK